MLDCSESNLAMLESIQCQNCTQDSWHKQVKQYHVDLCNQARIQQVKQLLSPNCQNNLD